MDIRTFCIEIALLRSYALVSIVNMDSLKTGETVIRFKQNSDCTLKEGKRLIDKIKNWNVVSINPFEPEVKIYRKEYYMALLDD